MKKIIITFLICIVSIFTFGQKLQHFDTYHNSWIGVDFGIAIFVDTTDYELVIPGMSLDTTSFNGGITLNRDEHLKLINSLTEAYSKYQEWIISAKEKNFQDIFYESNYSIECLSYVIYDRTWHYQNVTFKHYFQAIDGEYFWMMNTGRLETIHNGKTLYHDGFVILFSNPEELITFLNIINIDKINKYDNERN